VVVVVPATCSNINPKLQPGLASCNASSNIGPNN
jgi:hypothetical protein